VSLGELDKYYITLSNDINQKKEIKIAELTATPELRQQYLKLQDECYNESLEDFATNKSDLKKIVEDEEQLVQKHNPIFLNPEGGFFNAQFYAPSKNLFGMQITTLSANLLMIWLMTAGLGVILYYDGFKRFLDWIQYFFEMTFQKLKRKTN
jgi:hypothetical protein